MNFNNKKLTLIPRSRGQNSNFFQPVEAFNLDIEMSLSFFTISTLCWNASILTFYIACEIVSFSSLFSNHFTRSWSYTTENVKKYLVFQNFGWNGVWHSFHFLNRFFACFCLLFLFLDKQIKCADGFSNGGFLQRTRGSWFSAQRKNGGLLIIMVFWWECWKLRMVRSGEWRGNFGRAGGGSNR